MESHFPDLDDTHGQRARARVVTDLKTLARDVEDMIKATADDVSEQAKIVRERLMVVLTQAKSCYEVLQARGLESARVVAQKTDRTIRKHPYQFLAVALAVGVLLGAQLRRR